MSRIIPALIGITAMMLATASLRCSSAPNETLAGGTGTGNPGGSTTVSILIDTTGFLGKAPAGPFPQSGPTDSAKRQIQITDADGMPMLVTSAVIAVRAVNFTLDTGEDPVALLHRFNQPLLSDSGDISLSGPFMFDAVAGRCDPPIDTLRLPEAHYTGIKLGLDTQQSGGVPGAGPPAVFVIGGTFDYLGSTRPFSIRLRMGATLPYPYSGPAIAVSHTDTTRLVIAFDRRRWLTGVNIQTLLDNGQITLESDGSLIIDGNTGRGGPGQSVETLIRGNVISSGRLFRGL